jgi:hypothetical protein
MFPHGDACASTFGTPRRQIAQLPIHSSGSSAGATALRTAAWLNLWIAFAGGIVI